MDTILVKKEEEELEKAKQEDPEEQFGLDAFDFEQLSTQWNDFANQKKAAGRDVEYTVMKQDMYLREDGTTIVLKLTNSVKIDILDKFRSDLITHLKSKLNNRNLKLETELVEEENQKMIYTNKEKFEYLAEKKPVLNLLKDRLGLDPDF